MSAAVVAAVIVSTVAVGTTVYSAGQQKKAQSKAEKAREAEIAAQRKAEEEALKSNVRLNRQQMELRSQENQMTLLADLIKMKQQGTQPRIFTLPPAKEPAQLSLADQVNGYIHKLLTG